MKRIIPLCQVLLLIISIFVRIECQKDEYGDDYEDNLYDEAEVKVLCEKYSYFGKYPSPRDIQHYLHCDEDEYSEAICPEEKPIFENGGCVPGYNLKEFCKNKPDGLYPSQRGINYFFCCAKENSYEGICAEDTPIFAGDTCTELPINLPTTLATTFRKHKTTQKVQSTKTTLVFKTTKPTTTETITTIAKEDEEYCPSIDDPSEIIFIPNKLNCSEYFLCYHGVPKTISCGNSLYFNPKTNSCDLPKNVICETDDEQHTMPKCKSQNDFEYYNHPDKCYFFYICRYGKISLQRCPFMYSFDLESKRCIRAHLSMCIDK